MKHRVETIGPCTLHLGDCLEILPELGKVDAVVTDPPYGISLDADFSGMESKIKRLEGGHNYDPVQGDNAPFDPAPLLSAAPRIVLFGADYYLSRLPPGGSLSVWDKRLNESADRMFGSCYETIWFYPARKRDIIRYKWAGIFGIEKEDIKKRVHPTQKPVRLIQNVILKLSGSPQIILDPFMGSGTSGVACVNLRRRFTGIEIEEKYFDVACKRIELAAKQGQFDF
jgi:site-specific DNA-methyltransferase (adenine-specific)/modification methylase